MQSEKRCDGTATNTGWKNDIIRNFELKLGRPLHRFIHV